MSGLLTRLKHLAPRGAYSRHVALLAGGTAFGQGIVVLFSPLLTRIYTPFDFGILATFSSFISVLLVVLSLRYEQAIPLPKQRYEALALLGLSLGLVVTITAIITLLLWALDGLLRQALGPVALYLWLLPLGLIGAGLYQALNYWALREQAFSPIARTRLSQGLGMVVTQLVLGMAGAGSAGLLIGDIVGRASGSWGLLTLLRGVPARELFDVGNIFRVATRYVRFPLFSTGAAFLNVLSRQLPFIFLPSLFGNEVTGFFALAYRSLGLPSMLIGQAVGQVFFSKAAQLKSNPDKLAEFTVRTALGLLAFGIAVFGIIIVGGASVFEIVFGGAWKQAGFYAQILAPWYMLWLVSSPLSNLLAIREWQGASLAFASIELLSRGMALWLGWRLQSDSLMVGFMSLVGTGISLAATVWFLQAGYVSLSHAFVSAMPIVLGGLIYIFSLWMAMKLLGLWGFGAAVAVAGWGFYRWVKRLKLFAIEGEES